MKPWAKAATLDVTGRVCKTRPHQRGTNSLSSSVIQLPKFATFNVTNFETITLGENEFQLHPPTRFRSTAKGLRPSQVCIRRARPEFPVNTRRPASTSFLTLDRPIQIAVMVFKSVVT